MQGVGGVLCNDGGFSGNCLCVKLKGPGGAPIFSPACFIMRESELYQDARLMVSTDSISDL